MNRDIQLNMIEIGWDNHGLDEKNPKQIISIILDQMIDKDPDRRQVIEGLRG